MKNFVLGVFFSMFICVGAFAHQPKVTTTVMLKNDATGLFLADKDVQKAIKDLEGNGNTLLSVESLPLSFSYTDEGPVARFLVTAWLGKVAEYGWYPQFVVAKVDTDKFGHRGVKLVNSDELTKAIAGLK